jgi:hypothetical protein
VRATCRPGERQPSIRTSPCATCRRGFCDAQTAKKPQLDDAAFPRLEFRECLERLIQLDDALTFYATGITQAMAKKMPAGVGSQYAAAFVDSKGQPLYGSKNYRLHLPPNIPAKDFWSLVLYDNQTRSLLQTDQQFPSIGSQQESTAINPDTSADVYFGPWAPAGKKANWIQTWPGKRWNVILRLYGPLPWFVKTWRPGEIEEMA